MSRRFEWVVAGLLLAVTLVLVFGAPDSRPADLELQASVRELAPANGQQRAEVTVRWHWRRPPRAGFGSSLDVIGLNTGEFWPAPAPGGSPGAIVPGDQWLAQWTDPIPSHQFPVAPGQDGVLTVKLEVTAKGVPRRRSVPLHLQYVHRRLGLPLLDEAGWVLRGAERVVIE